MLLSAPATIRPDDTDFARTHTTTSVPPPAAAQPNEHLYSSLYGREMELMKKMIKSECGMEGGPFVQPASYSYHPMRGGYVPPVVPPHFYPPEIDVGGKFYHPSPGQRFPPPPNMACKVEKDDSAFHGFMHPFGGGGDRQRLTQGLLKPVYEMDKIPQDTLALPSPKVFSQPFELGSMAAGGCSNGDPYKPVSSKSVSDSDKRDKQEDNNSKSFSAGCQSSAGGCEFVRKRDGKDGGSPFVNSGSDIGGAGAGGGEFCGSHHQPQLSGDESNGDDAFTTL